jgi:hypothetical protein
VVPQLALIVVMRFCGVVISPPRASIFQIIQYHALLLIKAMGGPQDVAP